MLCAWISKPLASRTEVMKLRAWALWVSNEVPLTRLLLSEWQLGHIGDN